MHKLSLATFAEANVWLDELPKAPVLPTAWRTVPLGSARSLCDGPTHFASAIELRIGRGARIEYGMVGLRHRAAPATSLRVPVGLEAVPHASELVPDAHAGLPEEYSDAVVGGVREAADPAVMGGELTVWPVAFSDIGSNPALFRVLAVSAFRLLDFDRPVRCLGPWLVSQFGVAGLRSTREVV